MISIPLIWIVAAVIAGIVAGNRNRSVLWWVIGTLLLTPLMVLILLVLPTKEPSPEELLTRGGKKCPFCAEVIKAEAIVCRYCGKEQTPTPLQ